MLPSGSYEELALNVNVVPGAPEPGETVNDATGAWLAGAETETERVVVSEALPLSKTVRRTV